MEITNDQELWDLYGSKIDYEKHLRYIQSLDDLEKTSENIQTTRLREKVLDKSRNSRFFGSNLDLQYCHKITNFAIHNEKVHDSSCMGIFDTDSGKQKVNSFVSQMFTKDGKILYTPEMTTYLSILENSNLSTKNRGDLVSLENHVVKLLNVSPADGSGGSSGKVIIAGNDIYTLHGNHPSYSLTHKKLNASGFFSKPYFPYGQHTVYKDSAYRITIENFKQNIIPIMDENTKNTIYTSKGTDITSMIGNDKLGFFVSEYDEGMNKSRIINISKDGHPSINVDGHAKFL